MLRMPRNDTLVPKPLQGVSMWFSDQNIKKASLRTIQSDYGSLSFQKEVRQKKKIRKSLYFILKKDFLKLYAVLN